MSWSVSTWAMSRLVGLRTYQGDFTYAGLEKHLYAELRRVQGGSRDEVGHGYCQQPGFRLATYPGSDTATL